MGEASAVDPGLVEQARALVASASSGTLCSLSCEPAGHPYGSLVTFALDGVQPVFLISDLAEHTRNLRRDPRASLLVTERGCADPMAGGRVTLLGRCSPVEAGEPTRRARAAFLSTHPSAARYADFADFSFWRLAVEAVRYVAGFGRMTWIAADAWIPQPG